MDQASPLPVKVLIVEDQRIILWGLQKLVQSNKNFLLSGVATNHLMAVEQCKLTQPDIIVFDLSLSPNNGVNLIPSLLDQSKAKLIFLTSNRNIELHDKAVVNGARGVLTKDEDPEHLLKAIECVHQGELWLNRNATSRIFQEIAKANTSKLAPIEDPLLASLTKKERIIYHAVIAGSNQTLKAIAAALHTSEHTLRNHLASIYSKLGVGNRLELYVFSNQHTY